MIIAQITDFHITTPGAAVDRRYRTAEHLAAAVAHVNALGVRPDVVVATGDLVHGGTVAEYERLHALLAPLAMPVYVIPGNHDDRASLRTVFSDHHYLPRDGPYLHYIVEDYPLRLMALDTVVPGEIGGALCAARLGWIEARLAEAPARPTFVLMHHPPFRTGIGWADRADGAAGLGGADSFGDIVARHPEIERIVCGHLHRPIEARWRGTVASTAPATAHQLGPRPGTGARHHRGDGAASVPASPMGRRRRRGQPHQLHRRLRNALGRRPQAAPRRPKRRPRRTVNPLGSCASPWVGLRPRRRASRS